MGEKGNLKRRSDQPEGKDGKPSTRPDLARENQRGGRLEQVADSVLQSVGLPRSEELIRNFGQIITAAGISFDKHGFPVALNSTEQARSVTGNRSLSEAMLAERERECTNAINAGTPEALNRAIAKVTQDSRHYVTAADEIKGELSDGQSLV